MAITENELAEKRQRVERLRQQVAAENAKRVDHENGLVNDVAAAQLDAEATRLEAQLAAAKDANKVASVKAGASTVLDAIKADQVSADAALKAQQAREAKAEADKEQARAARDAEREASAAEKAALEKAAEANAKEPAASATHVPEDMGKSTVVKTTEKDG